LRWLQKQDDDEDKTQTAIDALQTKATLPVLQQTSLSYSKRCECYNAGGVLYLKLNVQYWRLAFITSFIGQWYLCCILQQLDDNITPSSTTAAINNDINEDQCMWCYLSVSGILLKIQVTLRRAALSQLWSITCQYLTDH